MPCFSENWCLTGILSGRGKHRYRLCLLIDIYLGSKEAKLSYRRYALWTGFPCDLAIYEVYSIIQSVDFADSVGFTGQRTWCAIEHQASGYKDGKVRYIGNRKARE